VIGNLTTLILRHNKISQTGNLKKLYALEKLDLSDNLIASLSQVQQLNELPCLVAIWLQGNPVSYMEEYRTNTLILFSKQLPDFRLDDEESTLKEVKHVLKVSGG